MGPMLLDFLDVVPVLDKLSAAVGVGVSVMVLVTMPVASVLVVTLVDTPSEVLEAARVVLKSEEVDDSKASVVAATVEAEDDGDEIDDSIEEVLEELDLEEEPVPLEPLATPLATPLPVNTVYALVPPHMTFPYPLQGTLQIEVEVENKEAGSARRQ